MLDAESLSRKADSENMFDRVFRALPLSERMPVAFGFYILYSRNWRENRKASFRAEFLPDPSPVERGILEAAERGDLKFPHKLPVTLEEFPSRIWQRARASQHTDRLINAGWLAWIAILNLQEEYEDDVDLEDLMTFRIPCGDLPKVIDLAALSPGRFIDLKNRIIDRLMDETRAGRFEISTEEMPAIKAWVLIDTEDRAFGIEKLSAEARASMEKCLTTGSLCDHHHTRRLGRLMFRFGLRRLASQCVKVIGYLPREVGLQFQSISGTAHGRIRKIILRPDSDADAWMREPALACSAMSMPLWLVDGVERASELTALFNKAEDCPWIFPRLQHVYQWHLALAGKHEELHQIEQLVPDLAVGLSEKPKPTNP